MAGAQGEEVGSNERSWPGTERPAMRCSVLWLTYSLANYREHRQSSGGPPKTRHLLSLSSPPLRKKLTKGKSSVQEGKLKYLLNRKVSPCQKLARKRMTFWRRAVAKCCACFTAPDISLLDAHQCLFCVKKRPRLPPCQLAFSSKT